MRGENKGVGVTVSCIIYTGIVEYSTAFYNSLYCPDQAAPRKRLTKSPQRMRANGTTTPAIRRQFGLLILHDKPVRRSRGIHPGIVALSTYTVLSVKCRKPGPLFMQAYRCNCPKGRGSMPSRARFGRWCSLCASPTDFPYIRS